jgi:hypothetical protein
MIKVAIASPRVRGADTVSFEADCRREGLNVFFFESDHPKSAKQGLSFFKQQSRRAVAWLLNQKAGGYMWLESDVCLAPGFSEIMETAASLYPLVSMAVMSPQIPEGKIAKQAIAGILPAGFYRLKPSTFWGSQAVLFDKPALRRMADFIESRPEVGGFDMFVRHFAWETSFPIYGAMPSPLRHMQMKSLCTSNPRRQVVSYRGVYDCKNHGHITNVEQSWEERKA